MAILSVTPGNPITLGFFKAKFQFGDCKNVRYSRKFVISESGTSENLYKRSKFKLVSLKLNAALNGWYVFMNIMLLLLTAPVQLQYQIFGVILLETSARHLEDLTNHRLN